jgi:hypothetical protein
MSWFQNPFFEEYRGNWVLGDRQQSPTFICPRNAGRGEELVVSWNIPAYDFTGNDADGNPTLSLRIRTAFNTNIRQWAEMNVTGTAPTLLANATTADEVVTALNSDETFAGMFTASIQSETGEGGAFPAGVRRVLIRSNFKPTRMKFYIVNGRAEQILGFNARAGVAELPTYFSRHEVDQWNNFNDSTGMMVPLDTVANTVDANIVTNAVDFRGVALNFVAATVQEDYELLEGRSGIFNFQSITLINTDGVITGNAIERIAEIIEYPAGAVVGDLGRKISYAYTGNADNNLQPTQTTEEPYTLEAGDLVTP